MWGRTIVLSLGYGWEVEVEMPNKLLDKLIWTSVK
jgi:hypothetical protein